MNDVLKEVGQRVSLYRSIKGWTQTNLAEAVGLSQGSISQIEKGKRLGLSLQQAKQLADVLGVELGDLYGGFQKTAFSTETAESLGLSPTLYYALIRLSAWPLEQQRQFSAVLENLLGMIEAPQTSE